MVETLYWITRLDGLHNLFIASSVVTGIIMCITLIVWLEDEYGETVKKIMKCGIPMLLFSILGLIFVPTTKEALMIYGVGNTIEYLQGNEKAKELPDKCIEALNTWVDSLNKESND